MAHRVHWAFAMMQGRVTAVLMIAGGLLASSCGYRWEKDGQSAGDVTAETQVLNLATAPSYSVVRGKVLGPRCAGCHQASNPMNAGVLLDDYASTKARLADIQRTVFDDKSMPKGARLSRDEAALLLAWLRAGGPLESPGVPASNPPAPPANVVPEEYRWPRIQAVVFQRNCASCHQYDAQAARDDVDAIIKRVLVKKDMPPPAQGTLSVDDVEALVQWLRYGMSD